MDQDHSIYFIRLMISGLFWFGFTSLKLPKENKSVAWFIEKQKVKFCLRRLNSRCRPRCWDNSWAYLLGLTCMSMFVSPGRALERGSHVIVIPNIHFVSVNPSPSVGDCPLRVVILESLFSCRLFFSSAGTLFHSLGVQCDLWEEMLSLKKAGSFPICGVFTVVAIWNDIIRR